MGYYMFAYGVKTSELQAVFSCKNEALLAKVQKDEIFQNYAEEDDEKDIPMDTPLLVFVLFWERSSPLPKK